MNKIRSVFLGGGSNSAVGRAHANSLRLDGFFSLKGGLFSSNAENNIKSLEDFQIESGISFSCIDDLINKRELYDIVHVLTPPNHHHSHLKKLINNGIPVLSEKPLVTSIDEARDLDSAQRESGSFFCVMYNYLGYPMIRELKNKISEGWLGKIHEIRVEMPQESFMKTDHNGVPFMPQKWRQVDYSIPTVSLDLGVHCHMLICYLTGKSPISVNARTTNAGRVGQVIDSINAIVDYEDCITANYWFGKSYLGHRNGLAITIFGDCGSAQWKQVAPEEIVHADISGRICILDRSSSDITIANAKRYERFKAGHPAGFVEAMANYYADIASLFTHTSTMKGCEDEVFGIKESLEGLKLLTKMHESSQNGTRCDLK